MTRGTKDTTYEELFERHLTSMVRVLMAARFGRGEGGRQAMFERFLEGHVFICSACRGEFTVTETEETDLVRCQDCGRCA